MSFAVTWSKSAQDDLKHLDKKTAQRILEAVLRYAATLQGDVKAIKGQKGIYRLRVGKWRVFFTVDDESLTVIEIVLRDKAYR